MSEVFESCVQNRSARSRSLRIVFSVVTLSSLVLFSTGCSFFSVKPDAAASERSAFQASASSNNMPLPLPVEIADDIKRIAQGQAPVPANLSPAPTQEAKTASGDAAPSPPEQAPPVSEESLITPSSSTKRTPASPAGRANRVGSGSGSGTETYVVKNGDTLMKISYEKFGNLYRWREIYDANKQKIKNFNSLPAGTQLTIQGVEYIKVEHNGRPYLIRKSDTLIKISKSLYGSPAYWRSLWHNNRRLIRDPNKIYAGFTLYYLDQPDAHNPRVAPLAKTGKERSSGKARVPASPKPK